MILNPPPGHEFMYQKLSISFIQIIISKTTFAIMRSLLRAKKIPGCRRTKCCFFFFLFFLLTPVCKFNRITRKKKNLMLKIEMLGLIPRFLICSVLGGAQGFGCLPVFRDSAKITAVRVWSLALEAYFINTVYQFSCSVVYNSL